MDLELEIEVEEIDPCKTCMGIHDDSVHAATLSVRRWLRSEINRKLRCRAEFANAPTPALMAIGAQAA